MLVDFLSKFIHDAFDHSTKASAKRWPDLEDIFTCVDLAANSGHHFGSSFSPADLRTVRRALLSRIVRMLESKYQDARKKKSPEWRNLDMFFARINSMNFGFISMNWDTVIERKLQLNRSKLLIDYGCDARPAEMQDLPYFDDAVYSQKALKALVKERAKRQTILVGTKPKDSTEPEKETLVIKIHGSINWLYCDNCRRLYWFHPDETRRISEQLLKEDDLRRIGMSLSRRKKYVETTIDRFKDRIEVKCPCSNTVPLGTRIATFSYRKALDFPMFQKSWFAAEDALRSAKRWVFIGYSLPPADFEFKYLLKRTQLSRSKAPEMIVVTGGTERNIKRTYENYQNFFGRTISKTNLFSAGLTKEAMDAICKPI